MALIEVCNLRHSYKKGREAIHDISFQIERGQVFGFIGPNGAGKTTTMRILATLLRPTAGDAKIGGYSVLEQPYEVRRLIGYMPDFFGVYTGMTVREYLEFFAMVYRIPAPKRLRLIADLLELVELTHRADDDVQKLSRGMQQRLSLARALIHDPEVLILDEPASGLDPRARIEIRELLRELRRMGKTIFVSSHILSEIAEICTHIGIIEAGELVLVSSMAQLQKLQRQRTLRMVLLDRYEEAKAWLSSYPGVTEIFSPDGEDEFATSEIRFRFEGEDEHVAVLLQAAIEQHFPVIAFGELGNELEQIFLQVTKGVVS